MLTSSFKLTSFHQQPQIDISGSITLAHDRLLVRYTVSDPDGQVKFTPATAQPKRRDELWRTTCFEVFVKRRDFPEYWEFNLAPGGDWNLYRFTSYRSALQREAHVADIAIETMLNGSLLNGLESHLPLPPSLVGQQLEIGASSVIEDRAGNIHYYALRHLGAKPDFHDPSSFLIHLDPSSK